jgi:uncharacterized membrane protein
MDYEFASKVFGVFALSTVFFWAAIPAGIALGLSPILTGLMTAVGAYISVLVVVFAGEALGNLIKRWRSNRVKPADTIKKVKLEPAKNPGLFRKMWDRWGLIGVALSAPIVSGTIGGTALVLALGSKRKRILIWFAIGIVAWATVLVSTITLGISIFK